MDFFTSQEAAQRKTKRLVFLFVLAVGAIICAIYAVVMGLFIYGASSSSSSLDAEPMALWQPDVFMGVATAILIIVSLGSLFKTASLKRGGAVVAEMMGGALVRPDTTDFHERRLLNIVEEMAVASGLPIPPVYLMRNEEAINAFAAGFRPEDAVVGVTHGCLTLLSREELQGVIAHEFSHILNGDMRLNIRLMGVLHGILVISMIGYWAMRIGFNSGRSRSRDSKGALPIGLFGLAVMVIGYIGVFFGKMIKAAVSQQREYLADASAVQFTRYPEGIGGALKKIGGLVRGSRIGNLHAEEASHMFFGNAVRATFLNALATHPPLEDRILRLDPNFDGKFIVPEPPRVAEPEPEAADKEKRGAFDALPELPGVEDIGGGIGIPVILAGAAATAVERVGTLRTENVQHAAALIESIPNRVKGLMRNEFGARAVIFALLLDPDEETRERQLQRLKENADAAVFSTTVELIPLKHILTPEKRLPLVDLCMPALKGMSSEQYYDFKANVDYLIEANQEIDLFEYCLRRIMLNHLETQYAGKKVGPIHIYGMKGIMKESSVLLSSLAHMGHEDDESARVAFEAAIKELEAPGLTFTFFPFSECGLDRADESLKVLIKSAPKLKKKLLAACEICIMHDKQVCINEAELFRAIGDSLDCPVPPFVGQVESPG